MACFSLDEVETNPEADELVQLALRAEQILRAELSAQELAYLERVPWETMTPEELVSDRVFMRAAQVLAEHPLAGQFVESSSECSGGDSSTKRLCSSPECQTVIGWVEAGASVVAKTAICDSSAGAPAPGLSALGCVALLASWTSGHAKTVEIATEELEVMNPNACGGMTALETALGVSCGLCGDGRVIARSSHDATLESNFSR